MDFFFIDEVELLFELDQWVYSCPLTIQLRLFWVVGAKDEAPGWDEASVSPKALV